MEQPASLTLEQQFTLRSFESQVQMMSETVARKSLVKLYENFMMMENQYKELLKVQWGIEGGDRS